MLILINYMEGSAHDKQGPEGGSVTGDHPVLWRRGGGISTFVVNAVVHLMRLNP